ncbi:50S ribosomal protein L6 [Cerasicoccus arenae]|uniref:Large ribosomal subunit protein uL6 n=1 Tax=Cerasicoccus arenae TaxID=424488 RepID=A0A8J3DJ41_9BACT|nr:50S ribosomal protein L6 [Cerasicoccus arenae]MBK1857345.1 50S ribosomal protein L6 [Cerasicoccus arenae]GHC08892.1 50S ribosomal protein L6 [Cerasicoccus arenae]
MSRIGKLPVPIADKVKVTVNGQTVNVDGPKGKLSKVFDRDVKISLEEGQIVVTPNNSSRQAKAMWGTARSIISGMIIGVTESYKKSLEIEGVGFKANLQGKILDLALGYSHEIKYPVPDGVTVTVDKSGTKLDVEGPDKQMVGQVAADIFGYKPVEPYKGKGVRIVGRYVRRKEGKKTG